MTPSSFPSDVTASQVSGGGPRVDIGWIVLEGSDPELAGQVEQACASMKAFLCESLPLFDWHLTIVRHVAEHQSSPVEPVRLLDAAQAERETRGWDFVFVVTDEILVSHRQPKTLAVSSAVFSTVVISTAFLFGRPASAPSGSHRLYHLAMHLLGRLNHLDREKDAGFMRDFEQPGELDGMFGFDVEELADMQRNLDSVADLRVEEMEGVRTSRLSFYARSLWENRRAMPQFILKMRPWNFPGRLSRLTTAAGSALIVLMLTAESWEIAAQLSLGALLFLSLASLAATSIYLLKAQKLLPAKGGSLREQRVVINVSTAIAVLLGMLVTYLAVFAVAWLVGLLLFGNELLAAWALAEGEGVWMLRLQLAALAGSLSVVVGALGASFEPYSYLRHVTHVDEEY